MLKIKAVVTEGLSFFCWVYTHTHIHSSPISITPSILSLDPSLACLTHTQTIVPTFLVLPTSCFFLNTFSLLRALLLSSLLPFFKFRFPLSLLFYWTGLTYCRTHRHRHTSSHTHTFKHRNRHKQSTHSHKECTQSTHIANPLNQTTLFLKTADLSPRSP